MRLNNLFFVLEGKQLVDTHQKLWRVIRRYLERTLSTPLTIHDYTLTLIEQSSDYLICELNSEIFTQPILIRIFLDQITLANTYCIDFRYQNLHLIPRQQNLNKTYQAVVNMIENIINYEQIETMVNDLGLKFERCQLPDELVSLSHILTFKAIPQSILSVSERRYNLETTRIHILTVVEKIIRSYLNKSDNLRFYQPSYRYTNDYQKIILHYSFLPDYLNKHTTTINQQIEDELNDVEFVDKHGEFHMVKFIDCKLYKNQFEELEMKVIFDVTQSGNPHANK